MNTLTICSALNHSYVAFEYEGKIISNIIKGDGQNYHSLFLIPKIKEILNEYNISLKNLDFLSANTGPGSFSGIRVALSIALVLAGELDIPAIALNSAEILLSAHEECDLLVMDARRDMYYLGTKKEIKLVYKDKIQDEIKDKKLLCDKRSAAAFKNAVCFEDDERDLGAIALKLACEKYKNSKNHDKFKWQNLKANYIQTPPIFGV